jgi:hypothetical protein
VITISGIAVHDPGTGVHDQRNTQSEAVVAQALRNTLPQLLPTAGGDHELKKFILRQLDIEQCRALRLAG